MNFYLSNVYVTLQCQVLLFWPRMEAVIYYGCICVHLLFLAPEERSYAAKITLYTRFWASVLGECNAIEVWHLTLSSELPEEHCSCCFLHRKVTWYVLLNFLLCTIIFLLGRNLWTALHMQVYVCIYIYALLQYNETNCTAAMQIPVLALTKQIVSTITWKCHTCAEGFIHSMTI